MSRLTGDAAREIFKLAAEMQAKHGDTISEDEVHRIAHQVGLDAEYVRRATAMVRAKEHTPRVAAASPEEFLRGMSDKDWGFFLMSAPIACLFGVFGYSCLGTTYELFTAGRPIAAIVFGVFGLMFLVIALGGLVGVGSQVFLVARWIYRGSRWVVRLLGRLFR